MPRSSRAAGARGHASTSARRGNVTLRPSARTEDRQRAVAEPLPARPPNLAGRAHGLRAGEGPLQHRDLAAGRRGLALIGYPTPASPSRRSPAGLRAAALADDGFKPGYAQSLSMSGAPDDDREHPDRHGRRRAAIQEAIELESIRPQAPRASKKPKRSDGGSTHAPMQVVHDLGAGRACSIRAQLRRGKAAVDAEAFRDGRRRGDRRPRAPRTAVIDRDRCHVQKASPIEAGCTSRARTPTGKTWIEVELARLHRDGDRPDPAMAGRGSSARPDRPPRAAERKRHRASPPELPADERSMFQHLTAELRRGAPDRGPRGARRVARRRRRADPAAAG